MDPIKTVERYANDRDPDEFERKFGKLILDSIDESCWSVFASEERPLETLRDDLGRRTDVRVLPIRFKDWRTDSNRRCGL